MRHRLAFDRHRSTSVPRGDNFSCALDLKREKSNVGGMGNTEVWAMTIRSPHGPRHVIVVAEKGSPFALTGIVQISAGHPHSCALNKNGEVLCWGRGNRGQLGNDATDDHAAPVTVVDADSSTTPLNAGVWRREYHCYDDDTCEIDPDSLIRPVLTGATGGKLDKSRG